MAIVFDGTTLNWYTNTIVFSDSTVSSPSAPGDVFFGATKVHGLAGTFSTIFSGGLAPDSNLLEGTVVPNFQNNYPEAFTSQGYIQGPGTDSTYRVVLAPGYRVTATFGQGGQWTAGQTVDFFEGRTVTGINTSHNGGTGFILERDVGV